LVCLYYFICSSCTPITWEARKSWPSTNCCLAESIPLLT